MIRTDDPGELFALFKCLAELDRRGITSGDPRPFDATGPDGSKRTLFTNVTLRQFSDADRPAVATMHIFLSEYSPCPAIRIVQAGENRLQGLVISVVSLRRAKAFLQERGLLGSASASAVTIEPSKIQGLNIRLVEGG